MNNPGLIGTNTKHSFYKDKNGFDQEVVGLRPFRGDRFTIKVLWLVTLGMLTTHFNCYKTLQTNDDTPTQHSYRQTTHIPRIPHIHTHFIWRISYQSILVVKRTNSEHRQLFSYWKVSVAVRYNESFNGQNERRLVLHWTYNSRKKCL